jgi:hypothetical protein
MANPSQQIPQFFTTEFSRNWEFLAQQTDSRLPMACLSDSFTGKRKKYNQLGTGTMTEVTDRKASTPEGDTTGLAYWIYRRKFQFIRVWDEDDGLNLGDVALPNSDEVTEFTNAENRTKDAVIIQAMGATRMVGELGTDTDAFPSSQQIAVDYVYSGTAVNSGLTIAKLRRAAFLLNTAEVPQGDRFITYRARQLDDMMATLEATSRDYSDLQLLKDGKIGTFMGLNWIHTEQLAYNVASHSTTVYAWHKSGVKFASNGRDVHMDPLPGRSHAMQLRGVSRMSAVRTENVRVVQITCDEAP